MSKQSLTEKHAQVETELKFLKSNDINISIEKISDEKDKAKE